MNIKQHVALAFPAQLQEMTEAFRKTKNTDGRSGGIEGPMLSGLLHKLSCGSEAWQAPKHIKREVRSKE